MSEQFYSIQENYRERFYAIPKVFFTSEKYKTLSNDTKMAYAILKDRLNLSIKNNWVDENGNVYFIYSNDKLMKILNCKKEKLSKIKKALQDKGLLVQKRRGFNKTNILYLLKPIVTDKDIYLLDKEENEVETYCDKEVRKSNTEKFENRTLMILTLVILNLIILIIVIQLPTIKNKVVVVITIN
ncbi:MULTISPECIES: replication initiator protein A [unclassified Staphylococcus]|uniref:replication initiator protein A n=1 Tax=unclassified Staphylococcus TaxID=91994 RepID=UPI0009F19B0C|nr:MULTISPECIES: replication initiator protein A [unclassified Staphylococcus]